MTRLSHLLLDEKSLRLFTLDEGRISVGSILNDESWPKLCIVNLAAGIIGAQRSGILDGVIGTIVGNNALARANMKYDERKQFTFINDEFYLGPTDLDMQLVTLAKYGGSVVFAHQYLKQVEGFTREVMGTAGTRICFKLRREDAEIAARDFGIDPDELTSLRQFEAFMKTGDEVVKVNTPPPVFDGPDYSKEIMQNCLEKYYLKHGSRPVKQKAKLDYETL